MPKFIVLFIIIIVVLLLLLLLLYYLYIVNENLPHCNGIKKTRYSKEN